MEILVTGATGFIGSHVIKQLLNYNCRVIASSANERKARECSWFSSVRYIPFNFQDYDTTVNYCRFFECPDALIHLGWAGLPNYKSSFHLEVNLPLHQKLLQNLVVNGLKNITVTGTCLEYGMQEGQLREDMEVFPANAYAKAKDSLRLFLQNLQNESAFTLKWLRLFYVYGKGQNPGSLFSQLENAIGRGETVFNMSGGEQLRDYLPVETMAEYIAGAALQQQVTGVINCCSGHPISVKDFVKNYLRQCNKSMELNLGFYPYPDFEPMHFWGDSHKLKQMALPSV